MLVGDRGGTCLSVPGSEVHPSYPWQPGLGDRTPPKRKLHRASQSSLRYRQLDPHRGLRLTPGGPSEGTLHTDPSVPPPSPSSRSSIRAELQASSGQPRPCRAVHVLVSLLFLSPSNSSTRQLPPDWGSGAASPIPAPRAVPAPPAGPSQAGPAWLPSSSLPPGLGITDRGGAQPLGGPGAPSGQGESGVPLLSPRAAQRLRG